MLRSCETQRRTASNNALTTPSAVTAALRPPLRQGALGQPRPAALPRVLLGVGVPGGRRQPAAARPCGGERGSGAGGGSGGCAAVC